MPVRVVYVVGVCMWLVGIYLYARAVVCLMCVWLGVCVYVVGWYPRQSSRGKGHYDKQERHTHIHTHIREAIYLQDALEAGHVPALKGLDEPPHRHHLPLLPVGARLLVFMLMLLLLMCLFVVFWVGCGGVFFWGGKWGGCGGWGVAS